MAPCDHKTRYRATAQNRETGNDNAEPDRRSEPPL